MAKKKTSVPDLGESEISVDAWRKALGAESVIPLNQNALTVRELSEKLGMSQRSIRDYVLKGMANGTIIECRKYVVDRINRKQYHIAYVIK